MGEGGDKHREVPEDQGSIQDLPQVKHTGFGINCLHTHSSFLNTDQFELPFPLNLSFPKNLSHLEPNALLS